MQRKQSNRKSFERKTTMNREQIVEQLHKGVCTVFFTKTDGSERTMHCTLNSAYAPSMPQNLQEQTNKNKNPDAIAVWDTDFDSWRSFRIESIIEFKSPQLLNG